jgi:hypothetical protein
VSRHMDCNSIEKLSINKLRFIAAREKIDTKESRANILDRVLNYFYKVGWPKENYMMELERDMKSVAGSSGARSLPMERGVKRPLIVLPERDEAGADCAESHAGSRESAPVERAGEFIMGTNYNVQAIVQAVVDVLNARQRTESGAREVVLNAPVNDTESVYSNSENS